MASYPNDIIDGREVAPLVLAHDYVLRGRHVGSVYVEGGNFELAGTLQGSLSLTAGVSATITGTQQGSVSVAAGAAVSVAGSIQGSCRVAMGAELLIERGGRLAGSLHNDGIVLVRGTFGGSRSGHGHIQLEGGTIKQPTVRDGISYYEW